MKKVTLIYASNDGHTKYISQVITEHLLKRDCYVQALSVEEVIAETLQGSDCCVIGAAVRYGKHLPSIVTFLQEHEKHLRTKSCAFFSVNLTARKPNRNTPETCNYVIKLMASLGWEPDELAVFAGKLDYSRYRFIDKHMIRFIMWLTKGPTNLNTVETFTNWQDVESFAECIALLGDDSQNLR